MERTGRQRRAIIQRRAGPPFTKTLALMTPTPRFFRGLILASVALPVLGGTITLLLPNLLPESLRLAEEQMFDAWSLDSLIGLVIGGLAYGLAAIVALVGLFLFKRWARPLNVALTGGLFVIWPVIGYNISSGWAQACNDVAFVLWGVVLAMAYLPPICERFAPSER